jgi:hypothetical protein
MGVLNMTSLMKGGFALALTCALAQPAQASFGCWKPKDAAAVKVRDLQSRLMVAALRCRAMGYDILPEYNSFVRTSRTTIQEANGLIKARFAAGYGKKAAQSRYDSFTTAMANEYGADQTSREICDDTAREAKKAAAAGSNLDRLAAVSEETGREPKMPGGVCSVKLVGRD